MAIPVSLRPQQPSYACELLDYYLLSVLVLNCLVRLEENFSQKREQPIPHRVLPRVIGMLRSHGRGPGSEEAKKIARLRFETDDLRIFARRAIRRSASRPRIT